MTDGLDPSDGDDTAWEPVDGPSEPDEARLMENTDLIPDLTHPVRGTILRRLRRPRTVAQLADALDVPITRLYHHVNRLEGLGMIRVVATRRVGAVTERRYQVTARSWKFSDGAFEQLQPAEMSQALGALFDVAKVGMQRELESGALSFTSGEDPEEHFLLSLGELRLTEDRRRELLDQLRTIIDSFADDADEDDPTTTRTTLFLAAYPEH